MAAPRRDGIYAPREKPVKPAWPPETLAYDGAMAQPEFPPAVHRFAAPRYFEGGSAMIAPARRHPAPAQTPQDGRRPHDLHRHPLREEERRRVDHDQPARGAERLPHAHGR